MTVGGDYFFLLQIEMQSAGSGCGPAPGRLVSRQDLLRAASQIRKEQQAEFMIWEEPSHSREHLRMQQRLHPRAPVRSTSHACECKWRAWEREGVCWMPGKLIPAPLPPSTQPLPVCLHIRAEAH